MGFVCLFVGVFVAFLNFRIADKEGEFTVKGVSKSPANTLISLWLISETVN